MTPLNIYSQFWSTGSMALQVILLILFLAYVSYLGASRLNIKVLRTSALLILLSGIGLYCYGFTVSNSIEGPFTIFIRSVLSAVEMFVSHNDLIEIEPAQEEPFFLDLFIFIYACAVVTSISALISLFGKRAMTNITLRLYKRRHTSIDYVFFGINSNSINLAKEISEGKNIAFIEFPSDEEAKELSFGGIIQNVFNGLGEDNFLNEKKIVTLKSKRKVSECEINKDMLQQMGLELLKSVTTQDTIFYLLNENSELNVANALTLTTDKFFAEHTIQCLAHKHGLTQQYELKLFDTHVHFFYQNTMAIRVLREQKKYHPVTVMNVAKDSDGKSLGYVTDKSFNALIYAFGESGREALSFIFRYSSFLDKEGNPLPTKIYIQDSIMNSISGTYKAQVPGLSYHEDEIEYEQVNLLSEDFWNKIKARIDSLNYIVFSCKEDEKNLEAAGKVLQYAIRFRKNGLKGLKVLVRTINGNENTAAICDFYNSLAGFEVMLSYGNKKDIIIPKWMISSNVLGMSSYSEEMAKKMYYAYYKGLEMDAPDWNDRNVACENAKKERDYRKLMTQNRFVRQYIDSSYYSKTLSDFVVGNEEIIKSIPKEVEKYLKLTKQSRDITEKLSNMLHLCWCRNMVLEGYVYSKENRELERKNRYLLPWSELSDKDRHQFRMQLKGIVTYTEEN